MQTTVDFSKLNFARVAIIGCPGSGKTTFSKELQDILGRDVVHLDKVLWQPNWKMTEYDKRVEIHNRIISADSWIIDGMWKSHLVERLERATLVIFLDYKRSLCMRRAIKRRIKYRGKQRDDIADGCLEKLDWYFLKFIWTFGRKVRPLIFELLAAHPNLQTVQLQNPKQTELFLQQLANYVAQENNGVGGH